MKSSHNSRQPKVPPREVPKGKEPSKVAKDRQIQADRRAKQLDKWANTNTKGNDNG